jgi:hypothetical protein
MATMHPRPDPPTATTTADSENTNSLSRGAIVGGVVGSCVVVALVVVAAVWFFRFRRGKANAHGYADGGGRARLEEVSLRRGVGDGGK